MADIYDKNILEFATVAVEYCAFVTKAADFSKMEFIDKSQKMLSLLYLKASMLPDASEDDLDGYLEQFVTELEWQSVQDAVSAGMIRISMPPIRRIRSPARLIQRAYRNVMPIFIKISRTSPRGTAWAKKK